MCFYCSFFAKYTFLSRPKHHLSLNVKTFFAIYGRFIEIDAHFKVNGNMTTIFTATNPNSPAKLTFNQKNRSLEKIQGLIIRVFMNASLTSTNKYF